VCIYILSASDIIYDVIYAHHLDIIIYGGGGRVCIYIYIHHDGVGIYR